MRVLLVEDDSATAQSIELMLKSEGNDIFTTDLGEEAISLAKLYDYDVILLDLNLPDMSGYEVIKTLKWARVRTPIVIVSGLSGFKDIIHGFKVGADDYLKKPLHTEELIRGMRDVVRYAENVVPYEELQKRRRTRELKALRIGSVDTNKLNSNNLFVEKDKLVTIAEVIVSLGLPIEVERLLLVSASEKSDSQIADLHATLKRTLAIYLPPAPKPIWKDRQGDDKQLTPPAFIKKYYAFEIALGTLTQSVIRGTDLGLYTAFFNWRKSNKDVALDFEFPTKHEYTEAMLRQSSESQIAPGSRPASVDWAARTRARRAKEQDELG